jgi:hypothetical protein
MISFYILGFFICYIVVKQIWKINQEKRIKNSFFINKIKIQSLNPDLLKKMNEKFISKEYQDCISIADKILDLDPKCHNALIARANSLSNLNFNLDAIDDYGAALKIEKNDGNTHGLLGLLYRKIGDLEKGNFHLQKSVDLGFKQYQWLIDIFKITHPAANEILINDGKNEKNLIRRKKSDFLDSLANVNKDAFKEGMEQGKVALQWSLSLDPENQELQKISNQIVKDWNKNQDGY